MKQQICGCTAEYQNEVLTLSNTVWAHTVTGATDLTLAAEDDRGLALPYLAARFTADGTALEARMWENMPLVEYPFRKIPLTAPIKGLHWKLRAVTLMAKTDVHDTYVREQVRYMARYGIEKTAGQIFLLEDPQSGTETVLIAATPDFKTAYLSVKDGILRLECSGAVTMVMGECRRGEGEALCRAWYRLHRAKSHRLVAMSNTWGDMNGREPVYDAFIRKEIEAAAALGLDIAQIDDQWQIGNTADRALRDENGWRCFSDGFWELSRERFPDGMEPIAEHARKNGIKLGLWFAPDSHGDFQLMMERDLAVLKKAHDEWGIRYFKLDMIFVTTEKAEQSFMHMLREILSFGEDVSVELDVTNGTRLGFLASAPYGTLFLENRYTKAADAFPHRVLRHLWQLSRYMPTAKLQAELVNPDLSPEAYAPDDPFSPHRYEMDYLFATTMLANPLFWMEVQFLKENRCLELARILPVWKEHRDLLATADVAPLGACPDGRSVTGFVASTEDGSGRAYLLLFREATEQCEETFTLPRAMEGVELLASNAPVTATVNSKSLTVHFERERTYAFLMGKIC